MSSLYEHTLKYLFTFIYICLVILAAMSCGGIMARIARQRGKSAEGEFTALSFLRSFRQKIYLPENSCAPAALFCPAAAFALLAPVCASIQTGAGVPLLNNGGDFVQMLCCAMASEAAAVITMSSLCTESGREAANRLTKEFISFMLPLAAFFASLAYYYETIGVDGDTFSLNTIVAAFGLKQMGWPGVAAILIFVFAMFCQIPHASSQSGFILSFEGNIPEYQGAPRAVLRLWYVFRAYLVISLAAQIFLPWQALKAPPGAGRVSVVLYAVLGFVLFWFTVIFIRVVLVSLCWKALETARKHLPAAVSAMLIPILIAAAMLMLYFDCLNTAAETLSF